MGELLLVRHGETEWSRTGRHTGSTDLPLTRHGEAEAHMVGRALAGRSLAMVLVSPLQRAVRTALVAGFGDFRVEPDLREWDYGAYEGVTTEDIQHTRPGWDLWRHGVLPGGPDHPGENFAQVGARCDRVLARVMPLLRPEPEPEPEHGPEAGGDVLLVAHAHVLRVLTARYLGLSAARGELFRMETASLCRLGTEHGRPVVLGWNQTSRAAMRTETSDDRSVTAAAPLPR